MSVALGPAARAARRRLVLLGATLFLFAAAWPAAAQAGPIRASISVQGAGSVSGAQAVPGFCARYDNLDDRKPPAFCGVFQSPSQSPGLQSMQLVAQPFPNGHWTFVRWDECPGASGALCTFANGGPGVLPVAPIAVFVDEVEPTVITGTVNHSTAAERTVSWPSLDADETATIECSLGGSPFSPCSMATNFTLAEGPYSMRFRAIDPSGNVSDPTAPQAFTIIDTALVSGPPDFSPSNDISFALTTGAGFSFDCSIDNETMQDCGNAVNDALTVNYSDLAEGEHTFRARARFGGDFDHVPIVRTFTVDTVAPETAFDPAVGPDDGDVTTLFNATFAIGASEPASLQCRLGSADFAGCASPHSFADLPFGQHRFEARAIDRAGNVDASPASRTWTIVAVDTDGDGFNQRSDCNENDPRINPAAREVRGNAVDENCDGVNAAAGIPRVALSHAFKAFRRYTTFSKFQLKGIPSRATVRVTCKVKKKKCPAKARKSLSRRNVSGNMNLKSRYVGLRLKPNTKITVTITAPEMVRFIKTVTVRAGKVPLITDRCVPPGARRPQRCR